MPSPVELINDLIKAAAGEEPGAFRGGDPEEIRIKREEKREEQEASGEEEDQDEGEAPSQEEIAEAEEEEKQKQEDAGKSLVAKAAAVLAAQVSPVDTFGDYSPRNANGDPIVHQKNDDRYRSPAPVRPGENQHKTWSEVTGIKVPMTDPIQEVRREIRGQDLEKWAIHKGGLLGLWYRWNSLSKGIGDAPAKGPHKYIKRWWEGDKWNYEYDTGPHGSHGIQHTGSLDEHSLDVHPDFHAHHSNASPEKAYEYAQLRAIAEGGSHNIKFFNKKTGNVEDKVVHFPGTKDAEGNVPHDEKGMPALPSRTAVRLRNPDPSRAEGSRKGENSQTVSAFLKMMHKNKVTTEKDIDGNPWLHWHLSGSGPKAKPHVMFDPKSPFSDKDHPAYGKMQRSGQFSTLKKLMDYVASQTRDHEDPDKRGKQHKDRANDFRASVPKEQREVAKDWAPTFFTNEKGEKEEQVVTNMLERGELGTWGTKTVRIDKNYGSYTRTEVKKARVLNFDEPTDEEKKKWGIKTDDPEGDLKYRSKILAAFTRENFRQIKYMGMKVLWSNGLVNDDREITDSRLMALISYASSAALEGAINRYDPTEKTRLSTWYLSQMQGRMQEALPLVQKEEIGIDLDLNFRKERKKRAQQMRRAGASREEISAAKKEMSEAAAAEGKQARAKIAQDYIDQQGTGGGDLSGAGAAAMEEAAGRGMQARESARRKQTGGAKHEREGISAQPMTGGKQRGSRTTGPGMSGGTHRGQSPVRPEQAAIASQQQDKAPKPTVDEQLDESYLTPEEAQSHFNRRFKTPEQRELVRQQLLQMTPEQVREFDAPFLWVMHDVVHQQQATKKSLSSLGRAALDILKAKEEDDLLDAFEPQYKWREGEPGAYKYMWDERGELKRKTNAPIGHPHFDPQQGYPQDHPDEPNPQDHPHMFDHHGRKLHRAAPEGVETEPNLEYDPDANKWSQKYQDENGLEHQLPLYKDQVGNDKNAFNEDVRHVDVQLEKVRRASGKMMSSKKPVDQAIGLMMALVDQAKMVTGPDGAGLADLKVGNVSKKGNVFKFSLKDEHGGKHVVSAILDAKASAVLQALAQGKQKSDYIFEVNGQRIDQPTFASVIHDKFGVSPKQFRTYHATEMFSREFQKIASKHPNLEPDHLNDLFDQALVKVARMMGHVTNNPEDLKQQLGVDPVVVEALFMSAIHHHNPEVNKSIQKGYKLHGQMVFQGLPVSIENRKGSVRKWYDSGAKEHGQTKMRHAYGYIRGTRGVDGDHVDVYIGPDKNADKVFVIHQQKAPDFKQYDEDKCMLGFSSGKAAKEAYLRQYDNPKFFGGMTVLSMDEFKNRVKATKDRPKMIKSFSGDDSGPTVWHVSSTAKRTPEEKVFGEWLHSHPMVEHDQQWAAFKHATRIEDPERAPSGREYAHQAPGMQPADMDEPEHEDWQEGMGEPEGEVPDIDEAEPAPEETAKSIISQMMEKAV